MGPQGLTRVKAQVCDVISVNMKQLRYNLRSKDSGYSYFGNMSLRHCWCRPVELRFIATVTATYSGLLLLFAYTNISTHIYHDTCVLIEGSLMSFVFHLLFTPRSS